MCEGGENELCVGWPAFSVSVGRGMSGGRGEGAGHTSLELRRESWAGMRDLVWVQWKDNCIQLN